MHHMEVTIKLNLAEMLPAADLETILAAGRERGESPEQTVTRVLAEKAAAIRLQPTPPPVVPQMAA